MLQKGAALVREGQLARGAQHQLHTEALLQRVEPAAHDGRRHTFGLRRRREAAARGDRDEAF